MLAQLVFEQKDQNECLRLKQLKQSEISLLSDFQIKKKKRNYTGGTGERHWHARTLAADRAIRLRSQDRSGNHLSPGQTDSVGALPSTIHPGLTLLWCPLVRTWVPRALLALDHRLPRPSSPTPHWTRSSLSPCAVAARPPLLAALWPVQSSPNAGTEKSEPEAGRGESSKE